MNLTDEEFERFMSKTQPGKNGCIEWTAPLDKDGYGTFYFRRKGRRAHRVAWFNFNGEIPDGMVVNHNCRNPSCVNHQHLRLLTKQENSMQDSASPAYLNAMKTTCKNGHPFDVKYGNQRYCSKCEAEKRRRLRAKWRAEDTLKV